MATWISLKEQPFDVSISNTKKQKHHILTLFRGNPEKTNMSPKSYFMGKKYEFARGLETTDRSY